MGTVNVEIEANAWGESDTNPASIEKIAGTNGRIVAIAFDDTTEEEVQIYFRLPATFDPAGNVTFRLDGFAATASGNSIRYKIYYSAKNEGEVWDVAFADKNSGDKATDADQNEYDYISFTISAANLGWAANDLIRFKLSRVAIGSGSKLVGDYYTTYMAIALPIV